MRIELARGGDALRALEIEHHALLVAIDRAESRAVFDAAPAAERIAAIGRLDLDHLGAEIAQQHSGIRSGHVVGELDDANAFESPSHHIPRRCTSMSLLQHVAAAPEASGEIGSVATIICRLSRFRQVFATLSERRVGMPE